MRGGANSVQPYALALGGIKSPLLPLKICLCPQELNHILLHHSYHTIHLLIIMVPVGPTPWVACIFSSNPGAYVPGPVCGSLCPAQSIVALDRTTVPPRSPEHPILGLHVGPLCPIQSVIADFVFETGSFIVTLGLPFGYAYWPGSSGPHL